MKQKEFGDRYAASQLARRESRVRKRIKQFYLNRILRHVVGPTVDIGCGAGQLLEQLPAGSLGLEVNPILIRELRGRGLNVVRVASSEDRINLGDLAAGTVRTAVLSHVLEHFPDAGAVLSRLLADCRKAAITRLIVVVPGAVGYRSDATHKTFVDLAYLRDRGLMSGSRFEVVHRSFFPGNLEFIGKLFIYHELMVVYDLK